VQKTVIAGLDGVPFGLLEDFAQSGVMPNTASLIAEGTFRKMFSSIPEVSSVAWSSMITGTNPGQHGIFGFMDLFPNSYNMRFPNYNDLKTSPFWDQWPGKSVIVNVPSTYPVRAMNGVHISGFVSIDFERSVYPTSLVPKLKELDYQLDVDSEKAHRSLELFLRDLDRTLDARIQSFQYLWDHQDWTTFMLVFTGTDRLMHFLWDAYQDTGHKYHDFFLNYFRRIDEAIGAILQRIDEQDTLIMLSDHGFEGLEEDVYVNQVLMREGFLQFKNNKPALANISSETTAFALDPARIHINLKDKYPESHIGVQDNERVINDLMDLFRHLEMNGRKVIKRVYRKEELYSGSCLYQAADLILLSNQGFNLKASLRGEPSNKTIFTGKHTYDTAFFFVKNNGMDNVIPESLRVEDVRSIIDNIVQTQLRGSRDG
jgi:predicted AlkP superfamily phosphohydrolase/phosphomutase